MSGSHGQPFTQPFTQAFTLYWRQLGKTWVRTGDLPAVRHTVHFFLHHVPTSAV